MKNYMKIKVEAFEEKGNRGGISKLDSNKEFKKIQENREKIRKIYQKWKQLKKSKNGNYIFHIEYKNLIPPKTKRIIFNSNFYDGTSRVEKISDVRQLGIFTQYKNKDLFVNLYYEINEKEYNHFEAFISDLLIKKIIDEKNDEHLIKNFNKLIEINDINNQKPPNQIIGKKIVYLLPIDDIIKDLIKSGILNNNNYLKDLNIAFLDSKKYLEIFSKFPDIIVSCENKKELVSFDTPYEIILNDIKFEPKWRKTKIGVIDSGVSLKNEILSQGIVFSKDFRQLKKFQNLDHGTIVSSLIIANDELNPGQKDGFGNFKVKHFEILEPTWSLGPPSLNFEHFRNNLGNIIKENLDIKVWNLSFGALKKPYDLKISYFGVLLDQISHKYNVIFVCPSGNDRSITKNFFHSLNLPADSLNALSVGSIMSDKNNKIQPSTYSSIGPILQFEKPEISYFGGPHNIDKSYLKAIGKDGLCIYNQGTSFAVPRISRMLAHYIDEGYETFEAKAKILNMSKREIPSKKSSSFGYIEVEDAKVELRLTVSLKNNKPLYLPLDLIVGTKEIIISSCSIVKPNSKFGEEYNIYNFDTSLIWYDPIEKNPEHKNKVKKFSSKERQDKKYLTEISLRMENGKYFNSSKKVFIFNDEKNQNPKPEKYKLALRVKKLDLFDTIQEQKSKVSIAISIFGSFNLEEFEKSNQSIIITEIEQEIE